MEKRAVSIRLDNGYAKILKTAMDNYQRDGMYIDNVTEVKESENIVKFVFDDPDEKFMFELGRRYGALIEQSKKETV